MTRPPTTIAVNSASTGTVRLLATAAGQDGARSGAVPGAEAAAVLT